MAALATWEAEVKLSSDEGACCIKQTHYKVSAGKSTSLAT